MADFDERWSRAVEHFCAQTSKFAHTRALRKRELKKAFAENTFIYGTTGPNALQSGGAGSHAAARVIPLMNRRKAPREAIGGAKTEAARNIQRFVYNVMLRRSTYDPGPRMQEYIRNGYQMMDMYYGMHGKSFSHLHKRRNPVIAEFLHYAMGFHERGNRPAFEVDEPGWKAFSKAFPQAREGWNEQDATTDAYGQSGTKELSKIIRKGIRKFGGTLIFEGKEVYGDNVFGVWGTPRDTDIEAQALFDYFAPTARTSEVTFGQGTLIFHWGGAPTVPSRAHFLTNWKWSPNGVHSPSNQKDAFDSMSAWLDFLESAMGGRPYGFTKQWSYFTNFPVATPGRSGLDGMLNTIAELSR